MLCFSAQGLFRTSVSSFLVATFSLWDMAFLRVSRIGLQLLGQLLEAASTEHQGALISSPDYELPGAAGRHAVSGCHV